ncbi:hypothetical protein FHS43_005283 [Streptosporangium becharense]|uniref:Subtilisin inhibitor domain-containing protein n=1 Tax=Streptosporangium becharense TaxID=1816182 RepID=A0A7W9MHW3_9ACTN|nr:hypothetical protein [Streptosporangium becharense]MBB2913974.1 hypothetical protein [Streptosporangium becharense]MBB5821365.1 hypothetical protein [Streptosporangium becharense]
MRAFIGAAVLFMAAGCGATAEEATERAPATTAAESRGHLSPTPAPAARIQVSPDQHRILSAQCEYADTEELRGECRSAVERGYRVGEENPALDCRRYSGVSVCGPLPLSERERRCVTDAVAGGTTPRRAEVECYVNF